MEISQRLLCFLFLASFAFGILLGLFYDFLYLLRFFIFQPSGRKTTAADLRNVRLGMPVRIFLFFEDLIFILCGGTGLLLLVYLINDGVFRLWGPGGMLAGFYVYRVTVSSWMTKICEHLISLLWRILKWIVRLVYLPIHVLGQWIYRLLFSPLLRFISYKRYQKKQRHAERIMEAFLSEADLAFTDQNEVLWNN